MICTFIFVHLVSESSHFNNKMNRGEKMAKASYIRYSTIVQLTIKKCQSILSEHGYIRMIVRKKWSKSRRYSAHISTSRSHVLKNIKVTDEYIIYIIYGDPGNLIIEKFESLEEFLNFLYGVPNEKS